MKILSLVVNNFLRIEALEIIPNGNTVTITGKNDQGKSSTLKAIDAALAGGKAPEMPIHKGALKGEILVQLGNEKVEALVHRTYIHRDGQDVLSTLKITTPQGARYDKPQEFLNKVLGTLSLDPVKFISMKPEEQLKVVRSFVPGFDFDKVDAENKADYTARTDVNRDLKRAKELLSGVQSFPEDWPTEEIDVGKLLEAIQEAQDANQHRDQAVSAMQRTQLQLENLQGRLQGVEELILDLEEQLSEARGKLERGRAEEAGTVKALAEAEAALDKLPEVDTTELRQQSSEAGAHNAKVAEFKSAKARRGRLESEIEELTEKSAALTKAMDDRVEAGAKAIADAKMPIKGLTFGDGMVLLNGIPFSQASFSGKLKTAIAIAAAHSPELRLIKIEDGDKLDDEAKAVLAEFAEQNDMQIWMETVQHGEPVGFVIEDGKLKGLAE